MLKNGNSPTLDDVQELFAQIGKHPLFLHIKAREKGPIWPGCTKKTYAQTLDKEYQNLLRSYPNTGVLLGAPSEDLCPIDFDNDAALEAFLTINPTYQTTLRTHGAAGAQLWAYITGERPRKVCALKVHKDSPLASGARKGPDKEGMVQIGEFRAEGVQSVIRGIHPSGCNYTWPVANPPITIAFDRIRWPNDIAIRWEEKRKAPQRSEVTHNKSSADSTGLLDRAISPHDSDALIQPMKFGKGSIESSIIKSTRRPLIDPNRIIFDENASSWIPTCDFDWAAVCGEPLTEGHIPIATATSAFMRVINWLSASRDFRFSGAKVHMLKVILDPVNGEFRNMSQIARECQISRATLSKAFTDLRTRYGIRLAAGKLDSSRATYRETQLKLVAAGRHASNVVRKNHDGVGAPESPITMKTTTEP